jgi:hypothetical protein
MERQLVDKSGNKQADMSIKKKKKSEYVTENRTGCCVLGI